MKYIEIAKGNVSNRGYIIPINQLYSHIDNTNELYRSYFSFGEKIKEHIHSGRKTPAGFIGDYYVDQIVLDVDKGTNSDEYTLAKTKDLVTKLMDMYKLTEKQIAFWFSGTGYHIHIPDIFGFTPSLKLPLQVRETIQAVFPEADTKPVNPRGLIRVGLTFNSKSGLYKTYIKTNDIWFTTVSDIVALAKEQNCESIPKPFPAFTDKLSHLIRTARDTNELQLTSTHSDDPTRLVTCMQKVYARGEEVGTRHTRLIRLASWQRRNGTPLKGAVAMLQTYAPSMDPYEVEKTVTDIYNKGYSFSCQDKVLSEFCDTRCIFYQKKDLMPALVSSRDLEKKFTSFVQSDWQENSINLKEFLDLKEDYWIIPEDLVGLIGGTGLNKTALVQNLAVQLKKMAPVLYINTEFGTNLLFRRFVQITHNMTKQAVMKYYENNGNKLSKEFSHIHYLNSVPNIDELNDLIKRHLPQVLIIDTIDDIIKAKKSGLESEDTVAKQLNQLSKKYGIMTIAVHHISKNAAFNDDGSPKTLNVHSGKGSSSFEQKCDILLGIEGRQDGIVRTIKSLKGRDNSPFVTIRYLNEDTFRLEKEMKSGINES